MSRLLSGRVSVQGVEGAAAAGRRGLSEVGEQLAGGGRWTRSKWRWKYGEVQPGAGAETDWLGNITVRPGTKGRELLDLLKHERVHEFLSPTSGPFRELRAALKGAGYKDSHFLRWTEEALASGRARYPFEYPDLYRLSGARVAGEAAAYVGIVGGLTYGTYMATEKAVAQPGQ